MVKIQPCAKQSHVHMLSLISQLSLLKPMNLLSDVISQGLGDDEACGEKLKSIHVSTYASFVLIVIFLKGITILRKMWSWVDLNSNP